MTTCTIDFTPDFVSHLEQLGLRLDLHGPISIHRDTAIEPPVTMSGVRFQAAPAGIGAFTYLCPGTVFANASIGRYCSVAEGVQIGMTRHPIDHLSTSPIGYVADAFGFETHLANQSPGWLRALPVEGYDLRPHTTIGNDVWIGAHAYIRDGLTIGDGAVIGSHAVVTRDVPPYAIVAGNPARILRFRFDEATVERLRQVAWWRCNLLDQDGIDTSDVARALDMLEERIASGRIAAYAPPAINLADEHDRFCRIQAFLARRSA